MIAVYSPKHTHDPLFISNYVTINLLDQIKSTPGVGDATLWGPQDYAMRAWVRTDRLTGLGLTTGDVINAIQAQNVQAAVGRVGARPICRRPAAAAQHPDSGPAELGRRVREHRRAHESRRIGAAPARRRAGGIGRRQSRSRDAIERRTGVGGGDLPDAGRQRDRHAEGRRATGSASCRSASPRIWPGRSPTTRPASSRDTIEEVKKTLVEAFILVVHRGLSVPRQRPRDADPDAGGAGQPDRHVHRAQGRSAIRQTRSRCWPWCSPSASWSTTPSSWSRTSNG